MKQTIEENFREELNKRSTEKGKSWYADLIATEHKLPDFWERSTTGTFTSHGKSHIESVEYYVDTLIGQRLQNIYPEELYILLMGALCHDLGMVSNDRPLHNVISYKYIISDESVGTIVVPDDKYKEPIALLCLGHRDYEENGTVIHTLTDSCNIDNKDVEIEEVIKINHTDIHLRYLAAILRLADELDVTDIRSPHNVFRYYEWINGMSSDSRKHWQKGSIIKNVSIESIGSATTIHLVPNVDGIRELSGNDKVLKERYLSLIFEVKEKIEKEIGIINPITFSTKSVDDNIGVRFEVVVDYDNDVISNYDYDEYKRAKEKQLKEQSHIDINRGIDSSDSLNNVPQEIITPRTILSSKIEEFRRDRNLLETGRFVFSFGNGEEKEKTEYTQYFINTQLLLTNRETLDSITDIFVEQFKDRDIDCVIGIGKSGIILSPNLALKMNCNSSYVICDWEGTSSIPQEESTSVIKEAKNILVLLDVISTGTATRQGIEKIKGIKKGAGTDIENIYIGTIFCTNKAIKEDLEKEDKVKEMFSIRDDFQFKTYTQEEYEKDENFKKGFVLLPIRKK
ncbi:MAG: hypothetical protein MJZ52_06555 [Bacteroidales bacterium]|nr:hypothetical protein [Bacteroidales bacterium]